MDFTNLIGMIAGTFTTVAFIPQVIKIVKSKSTRDVSLEMFIIFTFGVVFWLLYGILLKAMPIIIPNCIVMVLCLIVIGYKLKYK